MGMENLEVYNLEGGIGSRIWKVLYDPSDKGYAVYNENSASAQLFLYGQKPEWVILGGTTTWSSLSPRISIAVLGKMQVTDISELPYPGDDDNPAPQLFTIHSGKSLTVGQ
ncbi:MAG: hypothetical protein JXR80_02615 [Deltaproteobacteria bacterium]|nr:hypothetical protein [Deltaproteobacteria bacterium]